MNRHMTIAFATAFLACSKPAEHKVPLPAPVDVFHVASFPRPAQPQLDPRTPAELAFAACQGDGAWRCSKVKKPLGASTTQPITPPSWTVPAWCIDPANSSGCAADSNTGTSCTCGAGSVGPLRTWGELQVHRWGVINPLLQQTTTVTFASSQPANTDPVYVEVRMNGSSTFALVGTLTTSTSASLATVTAKARSSNQALVVTFSGYTPVAGTLIENTTHASRAFINTVSGSNATMDQPLSLAPTTPSGYPSTQSEVDTWTASDAVLVRTLPSVNLREFRPLTVDANGVPNFSSAWIQNIYVPDPSTATGYTKLPITTQIFNVYDSRFDVGVSAASIPGAASLFGQFWDTMFNGIPVIGKGIRMAGGSMPNGGLLQCGNGFLGYAVDDDTIFGGVANAVVALEGFTRFGEVYVGSGSTFSIFGPTSAAFFTTVNSINTAAALYGPGTVNVQQGGALQFANALTVANTLYATTQLDGVTTGTKYSAGTWTDGVTVSGANIDTNTALQNVQTRSIVTKL